ncbi:hypothetical protein DPMN_036213 [Dreissena polymorpha]|uniref:Uncharacterized protein n=1 Tax=Dreissena polymorpha TaxID=45954 RepID=A0A9D4MB19_DREPO|nr:hypothetical protein DPMN_036213 [Dreissena polymorpha]
MGSIPSQLQTPRLKVVNRLADDFGKVEYGKQPPSLESEKTQPKILVSIVDKSTVIISEGRSIATQTDTTNDEDTRGNDDIGNDKVNHQNSPIIKAGLEYEHNTDNEEKLAPRQAWEERQMHSVNETINEDTDIDLDEKGDWSEDGKTPLPSSSAKVKRNDRLPTPYEVPFEDMELSRYGKYKVRLSSDSEMCILSALTFLETGDAVTIDRSNQKLKFVDSKFQFISSFELPAKPWAVCAQGSDVYVTMGNTQIQHFTVADMVIEYVKLIEIKGRCLGICTFCDHLAVGLQVGEILLLDNKGEKHGYISLPETTAGRPCNPWHMCTSGEHNLFVTDSDAGVVFCISRKSEVLFKFTGMSSPRGVATDNIGNVLVVGRDKESGAVVTLLHKDVELQNMLHIEKQSELKSRTLMTWEELEFVPYCLGYRRDGVVVLGGIQEALKIMKLT